MKLNLGCGPVQPDGWTNVDNSYRARLATKAPVINNILTATKLLPQTEFKKGLKSVDLEKRLPWKDNSIDAIYGGEMLEHFTEEKGNELLKECFRILRPQGVLRMRVPDNGEFWGNYLRELAEIKSTPRNQWNDSHSRWIRMFFDDICTGFKPGYAGHYHRWMFDEVSLCIAFERAGFSSVSKMQFHESRISSIAAVEVRNDLIVEGVKL